MNARKGLLWGAVAFLTALPAAPGLAAPLPPPAPPGAGAGHWVLVTESTASQFIPTISDPGAQVGASARGVRQTMILSGEEGTSAKAARSATALVSIELSKSNRARTTAPVGAITIDLTALMALLAGGAVDFGDGDRPWFRASLGKGDSAGAVVLRPYHYHELADEGETIRLTSQSPSGKKKGFGVTVESVSGDGTTLSGQFDCPNGSGSTAEAVFGFSRDGDRDGHKGKHGDHDRDHGVGPER